MTNKKTKSLQGALVVLAAGEATRFGSDKRRFPLIGGRTMLEVTLTTYQGVFDQLFLVLKPSDRPWARHLTGGRAVYAKDAALGMGHSLAAGVEAARQHDYLFVALADMPHVQTATLKKLRRALTGPQCIVLPDFQGEPGHPVGFGSAYFSELQALTGDVGAKSVLARHADRVVHVAVEDPGVVQDVDVPPISDPNRPPRRLAQSSLLRQDS